MNDLFEVQDIGYAEKNDIWQNNETFTYLVEVQGKRAKVKIKASDLKTAKLQAYEKYDKDNVKSVKKEPKKRLLDLFRVLKALDSKDRNFYNNLTVEERKEFSPITILRWMSDANGGSDLQQYYIASTNHHANMYLWDPTITKHPNLQWLMLCAISPGLGTMRHSWIAQKKKPKDSYVGIKKELFAIYPNIKDQDLELLAKITTKKEITKYKKDCGA